jgi:uncharacterized protein YceK
MKRLLVASLALALSGCATVGPRPGESPCAYGRRVMDDAQRRLDQARSAAETVCPYIEARS